MSSADHDDLTIDECIISQAANGGWIVRIDCRGGGIPIVYAAVTDLSGLLKWLGEHLCNEGGETNGKD